MPVLTSGRSLPLLLSTSPASATYKTPEGAVALRLLALPDELGPDIQHETRNIVRGPDGETISDLGGQIAFEASQNVERPDWLVGITVGGVIAFTAPAEGTYTFEAIVDQSSASVPLHVVHQPAGN